MNIYFFCYLRPNRPPLFINYTGWMISFVSEKKNERELLRNSKDSDGHESLSERSYSSHDNFKLKERISVCS